ncbi:hypothetical protein JMA_22510 [Jeotgalibacillus malaysiensis]|uniref:Uncharacterized protein n=1 Tax=Jeotgalibacillus malaysiensis TaxID=1508404 RepID=A0A0B5ASM8_9BACL|nr:hypothetical protein [Jeotgalibacillus malaysiensis]AJD91568.1 hypothetical protein JMA_22510 [Jeotgalibacillus malaysiensis]
MNKDVTIWRVLPEHRANGFSYVVTESDEIEDAVKIAKQSTKCAIKGVERFAYAPAELYETKK